MTNDLCRGSSLRGIRLLALWVGMLAVAFHVLGQVLTIPSGFGIEDYLGWAESTSSSAAGELESAWIGYGVHWVAVIYLVLDTALFVPLYGALLLALSDKFILAISRDRALGFQNNDQISANWDWLQRWSSRLAAILILLIGIDLIENISGLIRMDSWWWAIGSLIGLICVVVASAVVFSQWWGELLAYLRWLKWSTVAWTVVVATLLCAAIALGTKTPFSPVVWAHQIKGILIFVYSITLAILAVAWFFGFYFDAKRVPDKVKETTNVKEDKAQPVLRGYEERAAFRRSLGGIILRSRYVLFALFIFVGLSLVMNQGRDVLYSVASHELGPSSIIVLALSALGMSAFSFTCWLWSRSVSLIRSPDTPESICPSKNDPARLSDRFAKDWARLLGLMPPVLFLLLCGATMRDTIWAENRVTVWVLCLFSVLATGFCLRFVFLHWRDKEKHFYNFQTFDEWHGDTYKYKNGEKNEKHKKYKFLGFISPFWLPFFAIVFFFLSRSIPLIGNAPSTLISSMLFALTFWLSIFGWISLNEERIAVPWVALLVVVAGAFGYFGLTQNHVIDPVAKEGSELVWLSLPVILALLLLILFTVFVAYNSTEHFRRLRMAISSSIGISSDSGLSFGKGALFVAIVVAAILSIFCLGNWLAKPTDIPSQNNPVIPISMAAALSEQKTASRQSLDEALNKWLNDLYDQRQNYLPKGTEDGPLHIYFVNSEGGGIRAAYWTAIVLNRLREDETFTPRTFSYSGVSGGSVGMAVDRACQLAAIHAPEKRNGCIDKFGKADLLSSLVSGWLFEDVVAQIIPTWWCKSPGCGFLSRGVLFERSLRNSVLYMDLGVVKSREMLVREQGKIHEPYLFLNSTWVESGDRAIASEIKIEGKEIDKGIYFPRAIDQLEALKPDGVDNTFTPDLALATAAHNSARFPFVNAIGAVKRENCPLKSDKGNLCGHLADGGYFDNSGGHTTEDILQALARCLALQGNCQGLDKDKADWLKKNLVPQVIMIRNGVDESLQRTTNCRKVRPPTAEDVEQKEYDPSTNKPSEAGCKGELKLYVDQFGPLVTAINTTGIGANGKLAEANLSREVESVCRSFGSHQCAKAFNSRVINSVVNIEQVEDRKHLYPLGWHLSADAVKGMQDQVNDDRFKQAQISLGNGQWSEEILARRDHIYEVISQNRESFNAFDTGSLGDATLEMIPYVVFRVLQEIEPAVFGEAALDSNGFFARPDTPSHRNGIAWIRPTSPDDTFEVRYMRRIGATCHTGRVRLGDGSIRVIHGGVNTELNAHRFIGQLTRVLKKNLSTSNDSPEYQAYRKRIVEALANKAPEWFWGADSKTVPVAAVAKEVATVQHNIDAILTKMREMNDRRLGGLVLLQEHSYNKVPNPPSLTDGAPGMVETSGLGSAGLVRIVGKENAELVLPPAPSKADIPAIWGVDPHRYANWDATLKGFARSLTSSLAVVGDPAKIDLKQNALIQAFLHKLPPEPYPFALDVSAKKRGEKTYRSNCAGCHERSPEKTRATQIFDVGTDMLRANAITPKTAALMSTLIARACPKTMKECTFENNEIVVDPSPKRGYVAGDLQGIWAQAPYLHNGSIPTLRQLLVPATRTKDPFLRGSISYDSKNGGWEWEPSKQQKLHRRGETAIAIHDIHQAGFSNQGHGSVQKPFVVDGRGAEVRIAWSDGDSDRATVDELIAYLLSL